MKFTLRSPHSPSECIERLMQAPAPQGGDGVSYRIARSRSGDRFRAALFRRMFGPRGARGPFMHAGPADFGGLVPHSVLKVRCREIPEGAAIHGRVRFDLRTRAIMVFSFGFLLLFECGVGASALIHRPPSREWLPFMIMGLVMCGIVAFIFGSMQMVAKPDEERLREFVRISTQAHHASPPT